MTNTTTLMNLQALRLSIAELLSATLWLLMPLFFSANSALANTSPGGKNGSYCTYTLGKPGIVNNTLCLSTSTYVSYSLGDCAYPPSTGVGILLSDSQGNFDPDFTKNIVGSGTNNGGAVFILVNRAPGAGYRIKLLAFTQNAGGDFNILAESPVSDPLTVKAPSFSGPASVNSNQICAGSKIDVQAQVGSCDFPFISVFSVVLSDAQGTFNYQIPTDKPVQNAIGVGSAPDKIIAYIPNNLPAGSGYRVKIIAQYINDPFNPVATFANSVSDASAPFTIKSSCGVLANITSPNLSFFSPVAGKYSDYQVITLAKVNPALPLTLKPNSTGSFSISTQANANGITPGDQTITWPANSPTLTLYVRSTRLPAGPFNDILQLSLSTAQGQSETKTLFLEGYAQKDPTLTPIVAAQSIPDQMATVGQLFTLFLPENLFSGSLYGIDVSGLPNGMTYSEGGLGGVPTTPGTYTVTIFGSDYNLNTAEVKFKITVNSSGGSNLAPYFTGIFTNQTVKKNSPVNIELPANAFTDPEGQALTWSATGLPDGLTLNGHTITGTAPSLFGIDITTLITITATDPGGLSATGGFLLTITAADEPEQPLISVIPSMLSEFSTTPAAPSAIKTLTITKINANDSFDIGFELKSGYEASFSVNGPYYDEDDAPFINWPANELSTKLLYIRLKSGLTPGNYNGNIGVSTLVNGVIKEVKVQVSGVVNPGPVGGGLQLLTPDYNCQSGAFTFLTTGGNGSAVEFRAIGITDWTTNPNQYVDTELRTAADAAPILLRARQKNAAGMWEVTSLTWDIRAQCPVGNNPPQPGGNSLQLVAPMYNCQSGAFTFQTTGGNGSAIEFRAIGITDWTTTPNQYVDTELRTAADAQPILLWARQSGQTITYLWDIRAQCPVGANPPAPNGNSLQLVAPTYNCQSGAFTFLTTGGNGSPIEFRAIGITDWTTNPNQYVDTELRTAADAAPLLLRARQSGAEVMYTWDIRAQCPVNGARLAASQLTEISNKLDVTVLGNPLTKDDIELEIRGAEGQTVSLMLVNEQGYLITERKIERAQANEPQSINVSQQPSGILLLRVSSLVGSKTIRIIKP
ncbi:hypothetical protein GCM10027592_36840 [Spirosoma flavus]